MGSSATAPRAGSARDCAQWVAKERISSRITDCTTGFGGLGAWQQFVCTLLKRTLFIPGAKSLQAARKSPDLYVK
eukprot:4534461-Amphidinium_carterae.3